MAARSDHSKIGATPTGENSTAVSAFESIVPVLHNPRCMNCHSIGDFPRQGNHDHRHTMNVRRGPRGDGIAGVHCSTCHLDHNLPGQHLPPGAPDWHLPSPDMPMIGEGRSDRQLCELFKDPRQNGNRTADQIVEHMIPPSCDGVGIQAKAALQSRRHITNSLGA